MGQVALGFRSLAIKLITFFIMASLLAWALGGELLPRPQSLTQTKITINNFDLWWRMTTIRSGDPLIRYELMRNSNNLSGSLVEGQDYALISGPINVSNRSEFKESDVLAIWAGQRNFMPCCVWEYFGMKSNGDILLLNETMCRTAKELLFDSSIPKY